MRNTKLKVQSNFDDFLKNQSQTFSALVWMLFVQQASLLCCLALSPVTPSCLSFTRLFLFFCPISFLSGSGGVGGQRHHQLQATSYPAAGYPCQPVRLSHREGRGKDKGDQRGEQAEAHIYSILTAPADGPNVETWREPKSPPGDVWKENRSWRREIFQFP